MYCAGSRRICSTTAWDFIVMVAFERPCIALGLARSSGRGDRPMEYIDECSEGRDIIPGQATDESCAERTSMWRMLRQRCHCSTRTVCRRCSVSFSSFS